jgi:hypothetical protein
MKTKNRHSKAYPAQDGTIAQTTYLVTIVATKSTPEANFRMCRQFTPTINRAIGLVIRKAAERALEHYVRFGRLDKSFRVEG